LKARSVPAAAAPLSVEAVPLSVVAGCSGVEAAALSAEVVSPVLAEAVLSSAAASPALSLDVVSSAVVSVVVLLSLFASGSFGPITVWQANEAKPITNKKNMIQRVAFVILLSPNLDKPESKRVLPRISRIARMGK
jgi:hypothetical protein